MAERCECNNCRQFRNLVEESLDESYEMGEQATKSVIQHISIDNEEARRFKSALRVHLIDGLVAGKALHLLTRFLRETPDGTPAAPMLDRVREILDMAVDRQERLMREENNNAAQDLRERAARIAKQLLAGEG